MSNNNINNYNSNYDPHHESSYGLFSRHADYLVDNEISRAFTRGWKYWPQIYYYLVDKLEDEIPEIADSDARSQIYESFVWDGNYEDYFAFLEMAQNGIYRNYMNEPLRRSMLSEEGQRNFNRWAIVANNNTNNPNNYSKSLHSMFHEPLPGNATNEITMEPITEGTNMVNFHDEFDQGRYYTKTTYNRMNKRNPYTRRNIRPNNITAYKARMKGGPNFIKPIGLLPNNFHKANTGDNHTITPNIIRSINNNRSSTIQLNTVRGSNTRNNTVRGSNTRNNTVRSNTVPTVSTKCKHGKCAIMGGRRTYKRHRNRQGS